MSEDFGAALRRCRAALDQAGIETAALDARLLVAQAARVPAATVMAFPERALSDDAAAGLAVLLARRCDREPMSHILGRREFWSLDLAVTSDVLTPRPDSETLIEAVLAHAPARERALNILDLGVGSGCLLLALLREYPRARGIGVDASEAALVVAARNAAATGLADRAEFKRGDWTNGLQGRFDIVVSNPPYIPSADIDGLSPEVRREPRIALDGGADGLDCYRAIAAGMDAVLQQDGLLALEIGAGQAHDVERVLRNARFVSIGRRADLAGIERVILAVRG